MSISSSRSERGSASSSLWVSLCGGTIDVERWWKGTTTVGGALARERQNRDVVEWWREWPRLRWHFYSSVEWESCGSERVADSGGVDSILRFRPERGYMGHIIAGRWSGCSELILTLWEGSVTRCGGVVTSTRGEAALERGKRGDDTS
jgi:hypothetical protein